MPTGKPDGIMSSLIKGFKLGILLDGQVGGTIYSMSFHKMMEQGKLTQSLNGRLPGTEYYMDANDPRIAAAGVHAPKRNVHDSTGRGTE